MWAACGTNEFEQKIMFAPSAARFEGYTIMGMSRAMFPNRISYFFDFRGEFHEPDFVS